MSDQIMQDTFGWQLVGTGPDCVRYESELLGFRVGMTIATISGRQYYSFQKQRWEHGKWERYKTAKELFDSIPVPLRVYRE